MKRAKWSAVAVVVASAALAGAAWGHDTWVVPAKFKVRPGEKVTARLATSEAFPTSEAAAAPQRVARFVVRTAHGEHQVAEYKVEGEFLVGEVEAGPGATVLLVALKPRAFELAPDVFNRYLQAERLEAVLAARAAAGKTNAPGKERYRKIAKTVLCSQDGGADSRELQTKEFGAWLEIVPETDLCGVKTGADVRVQVLFKGAPLAGVWVGTGYEGVKGHGYAANVKTDANGRATVKIDRPGIWFLRTLHMVKSEQPEVTDWDSAFSTITFEVRE